MKPSTVSPVLHSGHCVIGKHPIHGKKLGAFTNPVSIDPKSQTREYSANAYYNDTVAARPNLRVLTESVVKRVVLEISNVGVSVATGVEIMTKDGEFITVGLREGGEVILSAGALKSLQLLELSGVGDENLLRRHNICVIVPNTNVGENLQDHPHSSMSFEVSDEQDW